MAQLLLGVEWGTKHQPNLYRLCFCAANARGGDGLHCQPFALPCFLRTRWFCFGLATAIQTSAAGATPLPTYRQVSGPVLTSSVPPPGILKGLVQPSCSPRSGSQGEPRGRSQAWGFGQKRFQIGSLEAPKTSSLTSPRPNSCKHFCSLKSKASSASCAESNAIL